MPTKRNFFQSWNLDKTLSLLAFLISLGTFFLLYYQTDLTRQQQYASVLPYLEIFNRGPREDIYYFTVTNTGIGPAFVKSIKVNYKGKTFDMDPASFINSEISPKDTTLDFIYTNVPAGKVIPAGAMIDMLAVEESVKDAKKLRQLFGSGDEALLEITYHSVYDEKWVVRTGNAPLKIK